MGEHSERARGRHFLRPSAAADLVEHSGAGSCDLVVDLGAGGGVLTAALAARVRRVVAVELDDVLVAALRARFARDPRVSVVNGDATTVPLPREPFRVVSNLPFAGTTAILRRLLDDPGRPLERADLVVAWGAAIKRSRSLPPTLLGTSWRPWFELTITRRLPPEVFRPPPSVIAAVLTVTRRPRPLLPECERDAFVAFLRRSFSSPAHLDAAQWVERFRGTRTASRSTRARRG